MFFCPDCGKRNATTHGASCNGCATMNHEARQEYYMTAEGRNELMGLNDLSPDFYGDDYDGGGPDEWDGE